jgi:hypothetical protein
VRNAARTFVRVFPILLLIAAASPLAAQFEAEAASTAEGLLVHVDTEAHVILIEKSDGAQMKFKYEATTQIDGVEGGVEGLAGTAETYVRVHYRSEGADLIAERIEVLS